MNSSRCNARTPDRRTHKGPPTNCASVTTEHHLSPRLTAKRHAGLRRVSPRRLHQTTREHHAKHACAFRLRSSSFMFYLFHAPPPCPMAPPPAACHPHAWLLPLPSCPAPSHAQYVAGSVSARAPCHCRRVGNTTRPVVGSSSNVPAKRPSRAHRRLLCHRRA